MVSAQHAASVPSVHKEFHAYVLGSVPEEKHRQVPGYQALGSAIAAYLASQADSAVLSIRISVTKHCIHNFEGGSLQSSVYCRKGACWKTEADCCFGILGTSLPKVKQEALAANLIPVKRELLQLEAPEPGVAGVVAAPSQEPSCEDETVLGIPHSSSASSQLPPKNSSAAPDLLTTQDILEHELSPVYPAQSAFSCSVRCPQQDSDDDGDDDDDVQGASDDGDPVAADLVTTAPGHLTPKRRIRQRTGESSSRASLEPGFPKWPYVPCYSMAILGSSWPFWFPAM